MEQVSSTPVLRFGVVTQRLELRDRPRAASCRTNYSSVATAWCTLFPEIGADH